MDDVMTVVMKEVSSNGENASKQLIVRDLISESEEFHVSELCWEMLDKEFETETADTALQLLGIK